MTVAVAGRSELARTDAPKPIAFRYWPLVPALGFLVVVFLVPVAQLLWLSVVGPEGAPTLAHYARLFETALYVQVLWNTFKIAAWTTAICLLAGYPVAYLLATASRRSRNSLIVWVLMPFWTSFLVRSFAWMVLLGRRGAVNETLIALGLTDVPLQFIYNFTGVMVGMCHALMPLAILTMLSVMLNIDPTLGRAASTLGARGSHVFWRIYFPLSMPGVAAAGLLVFITALGFFITPTLLGSRKEMMIAQVIIVQVEEMLNWGFAGAIAVLLLVTSVVVFYLFDRILGMSTLTGEAHHAAERRGGSDLLGRFGARVGRRILAGLGWLCAWAGEALDRIRPGGHARRLREPRRLGVWLVGLTVILFLAAPSFFVVPISFSEHPFFQWPPRGFTLRWFEEYLSSPLWQAATLRSLLVGFFTAALSLLIGTPAAFFLARQRMPAKTAVLAFILSPIVLPHIIVAVALFYAYSQVGLVGSSLGLVLGHTIFSLPYVIVTVMAVLKTYDERLDQAAWTLGASRLTTFRRITLPLIRTGMITAFLFAFVKSFDELTVALFVSGGLATTLPRQMWSDALLKVSPTLAAVSTVLLALVTITILMSEFLNRRGAAREPAR